MNVFNVVKKSHKFKTKELPKEEDYSQLIETSSLIYEDGKLIIAYLKLPEKIKSLLEKVLKTTKPRKDQRTSGLPSIQSVFGVLPRNAIRHDFCRYSSHSKSEKNNHKIVFTIARYISDLYKEYFPSYYENHNTWVRENILGDWLSSETPFTTVNYNVNHAIRYHFDKGNLQGTISNVCILKKGVIGGRLIVPEYGIALKMDDGYIALFDGRNLLHGVTPIKKYQKQAYRASIVFYTLQQVKHCLCFEAENKRYKLVRTEKASTRRKGNSVLNELLKKRSDATKNKKGG